MHHDGTDSDSWKTVRPSARLPLPWLVKGMLRVNNPAWLYLMSVHMHVSFLRYSLRPLPSAVPMCSPAHTTALRTSQRYVYKCNTNGEPILVYSPALIAGQAQDSEHRFVLWGLTLQLVASFITARIYDCSPLSPHYCPRPDRPLTMYSWLMASGV